MCSSDLAVDARAVILHLKFDAVADGAVSASEVGEHCLIAAVWVDPAATDADAVYRNNRQATRDALVAGRRGEPDLRTVLEARDAPWNPYFRPGA